MATGLINELKRRHVFRAAAVYAVVSWVVLQITDIVVPAVGLPDWAITLVLVLLVLGLPVVLVLAWAYDLTPEGLRRATPAEASPEAGPPAAEAATDLCEFGDYRLDVRGRELTRAGEPVELQPRVFDLLAFLVAHRDAAVSKQQLQDAVWPGVVVTEASLTRAVMKLRQAVGDDASTQSVIKTLHGHGYRFVAPVTVASPVGSAASAAAEALATGTSADSGTADRSAAGRWWLPLGFVAAALVALVFGLRTHFASEPEGTRVAVLPIVDVTGDADLAWARLGLMSLTSDLIGSAAGLVVVRDADVVRLAGDADSADDEQVFERLRRGYAATHVLAMGLERSGGMLRMNYRLVDADGQADTGTMVDKDATVLARGVARTVVSALGARSLVSDAVEQVSDDPFLNEAFARGAAFSLEGRCADAQPLFRVAMDGEPEAFEPRFRFASCSRILGEPDVAESMLDELVAEQRALPPGRPLASALLTLGVVYNRTGRLDEAQAAETEALEIAESLGDHGLAGRILINLSIIAEDRGELAEARTLLGRALLAFEREGREVLPGQVYSALSNLASDEGDLDEADRFLDDALASFRFVGDRRNEAMMLNNRGLLKRKQGLMDEAESLHEASYALRSEIGDRVGMGRVRVMMAGLYLDRGHFEASVEAGREAAAIAEESRDRLFHAVALSQLGSAEQGRGDLAAAGDYLFAARAVFAEIQDRMRVLMTDIRIARLALARGEAVDERALALLDQARVDGYDIPEIEAVELLGDAAQAAGRLEEAADRYREAMTLLEALNWDSKETEVATKLADVYLTLGDTAAAEPLVGLVSQRPPTLAVYRLRARHAAARGDEAAAAELMRAASELGDERWSDEDEATLAGYRAAL